MKRTPLLGLAAALAVLLAGCSMSSPMPEPLSDSEIEGYLQARVDAAWINTGLDGVVERPTFGSSSLQSRYESADPDGLFSCLGESGINSWSSAEENGGPTFQLVDGTDASAERQLDWYRCFAQHPNSSFAGRTLLSEEEADYLYDYYQGFVIPCLRLSGIAVQEIPTRSEFSSSPFPWSPYSSVPTGFESHLDYDAAVSRCGDADGGLDIDVY